MENILGTNAKKVLCMAAAAIMLLITCAPQAANAAVEPPRITVNQVFTTTGGADAFTYILKPLESGNPMPEGSIAEGYTFTITGTGSLTIKLTPFSQDGVYRYKLYQVLGAAKPGYTYDKRVYTIEIHMYEELYVIVIVYNEDGTKAGTILFQNSYSGSGTTEPPPTDPPTTTPPPTNPPTTELPPTGPPVTELPPTNPPTTELPPTSPPLTELPPTGPPLTELPPTDPAGGGNGVENGAGSMPKTGYDSNKVFYLVLIMSGAGIMLCVTIYLIVIEKSDRRRR